MKPLVYIDGQEGTTGLQIHQRLASHPGVELISIDPEKRKDPAARQEMIHKADIVFLCLPDDAAREAVKLAEGSKARIIDASTAHRTAAGWDYGFPELSPEKRQDISQSSRVANPGCHATGFISIVYPLRSSGALSSGALLSCFSLTGYSGGGRKMIGQYEEENRPEALSSPGLYGLNQKHKHLPEIAHLCQLDTPPLFTPIVDDYYKGMAVTVPFHLSQLQGISSPEEVRQILARHYEGQTFVTVEDSVLEKGTLYANQFSGTNQLHLVVGGSGERFTITALFDNLGKGASSAAVQNMNLMLSLPETQGLI